jgi:hypothetical protein
VLPPTSGEWKPGMYSLGRNSFERREEREMRRAMADEFDDRYSWGGGDFERRVSDDGQQCPLDPVPVTPAIETEADRSSKGPVKTTLVALPPSTGEWQPGMYRRPSSFERREEREMRRTITDEFDDRDRDFDRRWDEPGMDRGFNDRFGPRDSRRDRDFDRRWDEPGMDRRLDDYGRGPSWSGDRFGRREPWRQDRRGRYDFPGQDQYPFPGQGGYGFSPRARAAARAAAARRTEDELANQCSSGPVYQRWETPGRGQSGYGYQSSPRAQAAARAAAARYNDEELSNTCSSGPVYEGYGAGRGRGTYQSSGQGSYGPQQFS